MLTKIDLDQYLEIKEDIDKGAVVFLKEKDITNISGESSSLSIYPVPVYLVQMSDDDFSSMDIGVHPKTFLILNGKEVREYNGIPGENLLEEDLDELE